jgi:IS1 family transposase
MIINFQPVCEESFRFPPMPIKHRLPEWYKNTPVYTDGFESYEKFFAERKQFDSPFTIKKCMPVLDYLTSGYLLSFITDCFIDPNPKMVEQETDNIKNFSWFTPDNNTNVIANYHIHNQCPVHINNNRHHYIKFGLPWSIKTPPGYSSLIYQPYYEFESRIKLFPAIVDTDSLDSILSVPGYINSKEAFMIEAGSPLVAVFPFKRDEWVMKLDNKIKNDSESNFSKYFKFKFPIEIYKKFIHNKKKYN